MAEDVAARRASDRALTLRACAGERDAQLAIFHGHRDRVHLIAYRLLGSNRDVDDIVQDSFLALFRALPSFRGDAQLGTFVDRITTRVVYRYLEAGLPRRHLSVVVPPSEELGPAPEARLEAREAMRRLYAILDRLAPIYRVAFALHVIDGRPMAEVASMMGATVIATKLRVFRARRMVDSRARLDPMLAPWVENGRSR